MHPQQSPLTFGSIVPTTPNGPNPSSLSLSGGSPFQSSHISNPHSEQASTDLRLIGGSTMSSSSSNSNGHFNINSPFTGNGLGASADYDQTSSMLHHNLNGVNVPFGNHNGIGQNQQNAIQHFLFNGGLGSFPNQGYQSQLAPPVEPAHTSEMTIVLQKLESMQEKLEEALTSASKARIDLDLLQQQFASIQASREPLSGKASKSKKSKSKRKGTEPSEIMATREHDVKVLVHRQMQSCLGFSYSPTGIIPNDPLASGEETPVNELGEKIWHPDWVKTVTDTENKDFCNHVQQTLVANEEHVDEEKKLFTKLTPDEQKDLIVNYFNNLRQRWRERNDPDMKSRATKSDEASRRKQRRKHLANNCRLVVDEVTHKLDQEFGAGKSKGLEDIIDTDFMDSCHSDTGDATPEQWQEAKKKQGLGNVSALEVRRKMYISPSIRRLHQLCFKVHRETVRSKQHRDRSTPHFKGPRINRDFDVPDILNTKLTKGMINGAWYEDWKQNQTGDNPTLPFKDDNPEHTILSLLIPDSMLDSEDLDWLADDEEEAETAQIGTSGSEGGEGGEGTTGTA
ncbi:hypothetical protein K435DRAFT_873666 [Dendrothele bispora CBS 962.96]|uniref:Uncharacterized protein n=1 Tax=Dendrothele bispora (strain CBS 962.96) TaxID=1314807 RepID=A0A4S8KZP3_DENBC|nr:hypothetical protein K435DRAFT_873666 [Dendrothele bispora CBS 962.96]